MIIQRIKQLFGIDEKPELKEQEKIEEVKKEITPEDTDRIKVVGCDDPDMEEIINRVWKTGKTVIANRNDDGSLDIQELD